MEDNLTVVQGLQRGIVVVGVVASFCFRSFDADMVGDAIFVVRVICYIISWTPETLCLPNPKRNGVHFYCDSAGSREPREV